MIVLLIGLGAAAVSYLVLSALVEQRERRDREVFLKAYSRHGGHAYRNPEWKGTDWEAIAKWGQERRAQVQAADHKTGGAA